MVKYNSLAWVSKDDAPLELSKKLLHNFRTSHWQEWREPLSANLSCISLV